MPTGIPTSLTDAILAGVDSAISRIHTSMPGRIVSYDSAAQTADVQPIMKRVLFDIDGNKIFEDFPLLPAVPICFPRGGGYVVTFPLAPGDTVVLVFSEVALSEFLAGGQDEVQQWDSRSHHLSNAIAIPSIAPDTRPLAAVDDSARQGGIVIGRDGGTEQVRIASGEIRLGADATDFVALASKVQTALDNIRTVFNSHTHATAGTGAPSPPISGTAGILMPAQGPVAAALVKAK